MAPRGSSLATCVESNRVLLLGQFISVLITFTGIFSQLLNRYYEVRSSSLAGCQLEPIVTICEWL